MTFKDPITIITTTKLEEVIPCMQSIQQYIEAGYYAAGYLAYEAAPAFDPAQQVNNCSTLPLLWFGIFAQPSDEIMADTKAFHLTEWKPTTSLEDYQQNLKMIKQHIENGDTYQVNYTVRLQSQFNGDTRSYFQQLAQAQSANYAAYLDIGDHSILSASPELFFHLRDGKITTKPMKGTVKRGNSQQEDKQLADWLYHSDKNRAENVMIVDLLRNDLGLIAKPGTVKVPKLFAIEHYPTVFQMTSTVEAEVDSDITTIFRALFPCGSITGAPKINTMKIINQLEDSAREVYCGTVGYITPEKEAIFNVPIRTVLVNNTTGNALYGVGGGITWDSTDDEEYTEILTKALFLSKAQSSVELLETISLIDSEYYLIDYHMNRLEKSAAYFSIPLHRDKLYKLLVETANQHSIGSFRVRLVISNLGDIIISAEKDVTTLPASPAKVELAKYPINKKDVFYYHKTTHRSIYQVFLNEFPEAFDVLLWNDQRELTEFTIGNLVVEINGGLYTPPLECGLLPGTFRQKLLDDNIISERKIRIEEIKNCANIWLINSIRKWVPVVVHIKD